MIERKTEAVWSGDVTRRLSTRRRFGYNRGDEHLYIDTVRTAEAVVDVSGLVVTPGFIDAHSHADFTLPRHPAADVLVRQGCTTVVTGNCGFSPWPTANRFHSSRRPPMRPPRTSRPMANGWPIARMKQERGKCTFRDLRRSERPLRRSANG